MIAIQVEKPHALALVEGDPAEPGPNEVLVRVRRAGICGSDMHILHGSNPFARYPRIIGHEFAGEVEAVGRDVTELVPGDRVVVDPVVACGTLLRLPGRPPERLRQARGVRRSS